MPVFDSNIACWDKHVESDAGRLNPVAERFFFPSTTCDYAPRVGGATNFTSLPREIRDQIDGLTLSLRRWRTGWAKVSPSCLRGIENGPYNDRKRWAFGLLSTKASTFQIVAEARQFFYKKNMLKLDLQKSCQIANFISKPYWMIARTHLEGLMVQPSDLKNLGDPFTDTTQKLLTEMDQLLACPSLKRVQIRIWTFTGDIIYRQELRRVLSVVSGACEGLQASLGDGLEFHILQNCEDDYEDDSEDESHTSIWLECSKQEIQKFCDHLRRLPEGKLRWSDAASLGHQYRGDKDFARASSVGVYDKDLMYDDYC